MGPIMPQSAITRLIQITTSGGWGGRETLPLAIHRWRRQRGLDSQLIVAAGSPLADSAGGDEGLIAISGGRGRLAMELRRFFQDTRSSGTTAIICHFTRDLPAIRFALVDDSETLLIVVKHVGPGPPKHGIGHRIVYRRVNRLLAVSEYVRERCARVYPIDPARTAVWYPGVDIDRFTFDAAECERIRRETACGAGEIVMGYVARITPNKGIEDLLDATCRLRAAHPTMRLWIAGKSSPDESGYERGLHDRIASLGLADTVRLAGWQDKPEAFLSAIDLFVVPSQYEAFGLSTVEAMACARPVAGFRAAGTAEIVADHQTGLLADPRGDAAGNLAQSIRTLLDHPDRRREFGQRGRQRAETVFSHQAMIDRLDANLKELA